jgi:hypothetical protein
VRETKDGEVTIEHKGIPLPARAFAKDGRVDQAAIVENKALSAVLAEVQQRQRERDVSSAAGEDPVSNARPHLFWCSLAVDDVAVPPVVAAPLSPQGHEGLVRTAVRLERVAHGT